MRWGGIFDLDDLRHEVDRLTNLSSEPGFWDDQQAAQKLMRERANAEAKVRVFEKIKGDIEALGELLELAAEDDDESMVADVAAQFPELEEGIRELELKRMLSDKDDTDAILSVKPGAGGVDAHDWADMLLRMYSRWCQAKGYQTEMLSRQAGDEAGISHASLLVKGPYAYGYLRAENGVHRLIRISPFDANKRRHTAFAAVSVVPNLDDDIAADDIKIRDEDIEVTTMRSGGAGGQHVNRTESAVRIRHLPTGYVVRCDAERSQHQNRDTAMKMLRGFLYEKARREQEQAFEEAFVGDQSEIAFGSQARTYTLHPYTMVKDERTDHKTGSAQAVLDGDLDTFIETYLLQNADRRNEKSSDEDEEL